MGFDLSRLKGSKQPALSARIVHSLSLTFMFDVVGPSAPSN